MFNFIRSLTVYTLYDIILMRNKTVYTYLRSFLLWQPWSFYQSDTSFSGQWVSVSPKPTCTRDFIERYKNIQCYHEYIYPKLTILNEHLSCFSQDERLFPTVKCLTIYKKQQFFCFRRALRQRLTNTILVSLYWCLKYVSKSWFQVYMLHLISFLIIPFLALQTLCSIGLLCADHSSITKQDCALVLPWCNRWLEKLTFLYIKLKCLAPRIS